MTRVDRNDSLLVMNTGTSFPVAKATDGNIKLKQVSELQSRSNGTEKASERSQVQRAASR